MEQFALFPALQLSRPGQPLVTRLKEAISIVRTHAIETGELASIRLVRLLENAASPAEIAEAGAAFRDWAQTRGIGKVPS